MKKKEIIWLVGLAVFLIAGAIIASQLIKQKSFERQTQMRISQENKVLDLELAKESAIKEEQEWNKKLLNGCLSIANDNYWNYMELNGTGKRDDENGVSAPMRVWDIAKQDKKDAEDACYRNNKD